MIISVYLHKHIADILECFGDLSDVINKILQEGENGNYELENKPKCESRVGAGRYDINVTNEYYLTLLSTYPITSSKISLRRLIYWFVENEIYEELGWAPIFRYQDKRTIRLNKRIERLKNDITRMQKTVKYDARMICSKILQLLEEIKEITNE